MFEGSQTVKQRRLKYNILLFPIQRKMQNRWVLTVFTQLFINCSLYHKRICTFVVLYKLMILFKKIIVMYKTLNNLRKEKNEEILSFLYIKNMK